MADNFNWNDYEKADTKSSSKDESFNWDDHPVAEEGFRSKAEDLPSLSELKSLGRGAAQGLSFNLSDELTGGAEALGRAAVGGDKFKDLLQNYQKYRDESRANYKAAEQENPGLYLTGEIGGGLAPALLSGGASAVASVGKVGAKEAAKQLAKVGLAQGAATGFGSSEADLTKGDILGAAKDTAIGAGIGGATAVALPMAAKQAAKGVGAVGEFVADKAPVVFEKGKKAYDLAQKGISVVGKKAREQLDTDATTMANKLITDFRKQYEKGSDKVGAALKSNTEGLDFSKQLGELEETLKNSSMLPDDLAKIQKELDLYKEINTTETVNSGLDKAVKKMDDLIAKAKSASSALGEDVSFTPPENIDNKFLQSVKTQKTSDQIIDKTVSAQEGTGLAKGTELMNQKIAKAKAEAQQLGQQLTVGEPVFDKESNSLITTISTKDANGNDVARTISQNIPKDQTMSIPTFGDKNTANVMQVDIPEDEIIKNTVESYKNLSLEDLNNVKAALTEAQGKQSLDSKSKSIIKTLKANVDDMIMKNMDDANQKLYTQGNQDIRSAYKAGDIIPEFSPSSRFDSDLDLPLTKKLLSPAKESQIDRALGYGTQLDPASKEMIGDLPVRKELEKNLAGEGGFFGGLINPKGMAIRTGEALGTVAKKVQPITNFTKHVVNMDDTLLLNRAASMKNSGNEGISRLGTTLEKALQDTTKRDRLLWSLSQQPAFREFFNEQEQKEN